MPDAWQVEYLPEAAEDFHSLDHSQQLLVAKAIDKVAQNPLPQAEGGLWKAAPQPIDRIAENQTAWCRFACGL